MLKYSYAGSAPERLFVTTYGTLVRRERVNLDLVWMTFVTSCGAERVKKKKKKKKLEEKQNEKGGCFVTYPLFAMYKPDPL